MNAVQDLQAAGVKDVMTPIIRSAQTVKMLDISVTNVVVQSCRNMVMVMVYMHIKQKDRYQLGTVIRPRKPIPSLSTIGVPAGGEAHAVTEDVIIKQVANWNKTASTEQSLSCS